jgi:2-phospho-L-lactate guanylyltransferase
VRVAVLVPIKRFTAAKGRLASVLDDDARARLAEWMASRVLAANSGRQTYVACDDDDVSAWAVAHGAKVLWGPGLGLNGAVDDGVARIRADGFDHVVVSHADLPRPNALAEVASPGTITLVPDRRRDGTNVMSFPLATPLSAAYGGGSFRRHLDEALAAADAMVAVEVRRDSELSLDLDTPDDLTHPMIAEVLPPWLRTLLASRR